MNGMNGMNGMNVDSLGILVRVEKKVQKVLDEGVSPW